ncbi:fimbrillin family protein, partial [Bacteroides sp. OttesenSCG-928-D19]|nr:fimbrillin family protein [Bacteroides sp. OttesenSCG-928-D19]
PVEKTVKISVDGNIALDNDDIVDGASLHIKVSKGATPIEVAGLRSMTTYNKSTDDWADLSPVLYWDDIPVSTTTIANAILFNKAGGVSVINDNPEYIYQGNSQTLDAAVTFLRFEDMIHPFSKVNIKIRTEKGANKVDLTKLTNITFYSTIQQFSSIGIQTDATASTQAITYKTNEDSNVLLSISSPSETTEGTPIYEYYDVDPIYIKPIATIASDKELLRIFYGDGDIKNEYPLILNAGVTFEKNKKYDIVVTLKKTEIAEVSVSIMPWGDGGTIDGGEAGIDK